MKTDLIMYSSQVRIMNRDLCVEGLQEQQEEEAKYKLVKTVEDDGHECVHWPQIRDWKTDSYVVYEGVKMLRNIELQPYVRHPQYQTITFVVLVKEN